MEIVSEDRLLYLARQIARMRLRGVKRRELANIALETLVVRMEMENIAKEKLSVKQKQAVKTNLKRLADLEKSVVSLYFLGRLRGERWADSSIFDSFVRHYTFKTER